MKGNKRSAFAIITIAVCLAFFLLTLGTSMSAILKFALSVGVLAACGFTLSRLYKLEGWYGIYLLRSQKGLDFLDRMAKKHPQLWQALADIGLVIGFGSLAYFLMGHKKKDMKRSIAVYSAGAFSLVVLLNFVAPVSMAVIFSLLSGGSEFASAGSKLQTSLSGFEYFKYAAFALMIVGGLGTATAVSIIAYAGMVASAVILALIGNGAPLASTSPGGVPIIPGINLPLIEGVAALAVVLIVHEGMHGILARLHKLPLKSAGLVFFGFLPFGAFVDIDEKKLFKEKREIQNSVFVAGTASNFATSAIFMLLFFTFIFAIGDTKNIATVMIARFLGLTFALNFIVAAMNLVPLPFFDGYYIMKNGVKNELVAKIITYLLGAAFVLTLLPWVFR